MRGRRVGVSHRFTAGRETGRKAPQSGPERQITGRDWIGLAFFVALYGATFLV